MVALKQLIYYIDKGNGYFEPFYEYMATNVGIDEFYARQLCTYFIMRGTQFERRSVDDKVGVYRLENKTMEGSGKLNFSNVEGLAGTSKSKSVRDSITAAFNYFAENAIRLVSAGCEGFDYSLYFNDLQNRGVSDEISVAEVVGLFSALANRSVLPSLVVVGRVVMSGSMMPITTDLDIVSQI